MGPGPHFRARFGIADPTPFLGAISCHFMQIRDIPELGAFWIPGKARRMIFFHAIECRCLGRGMIKHWKLGIALLGLAAGAAWAQTPVKRGRFLEKRFLTPFSVRYDSLNWQEAK